MCQLYVLKHRVDRWVGQ